MGQRKVLSYKFNMSLGFIPVIISIILSEFIPQDIAIYIGAGIGAMYFLLTWRHKAKRIPLTILGCTTGVLLVLSVVALFSSFYCPRYMLPFTLEISVLIPPLIIFFNRRKFLKFHTIQTKRCINPLFAQRAESTIVSTRVVLIMGALHLIILFFTILFFHPISITTRYLLFNIAPIVVFILTILFNQFGIHYFNTLMEQTQFIPIVNKKGDVIGKTMVTESLKRKNKYINPVIRIAITSHGMLFLLPRPECCIHEKGKTDLFIESYLLYGENLEQGVSRILARALPAAPLTNLYFNFRHHFENEISNKLVYLFTLDLDDDSILCDPAFKEGKLWTPQQIEHNLGQGFFSRCFEYEYDYIKTVIDTREKYKVF